MVTIAPSTAPASAPSDQPVPLPGQSLGIGVLGDPRGPLHDAEVQALIRQLREDLQRFARADTSVTAQALKLVAANPDAMLIVASGSGAAMVSWAWLLRATVSVAWVESTG